MKRIAVLGLGNRAGSLLNELQKHAPECVVAAVAEPNEHNARALIAQYPIACTDDLAFVARADDLVERAAEFDGLFITTWCHLHAQLAVAAAASGVPILLEKAIALTEDDMAALAAAFADRPDQVIVSFPLRVTPLFTAAREVVRSGRLGVINQVVAWNAVSYGGAFYTTWHRDQQKNGGLWLQKATHDFDCINALLEDTEPQSVAAVSSLRNFGGTMPDDLYCSGCDLTQSCWESPRNLQLRGDYGGMNWINHLCAFSQSTCDQDSGSAVIRYANGVHASYTQNFTSRRSALKRGMTVTGYRGTLEFDWYTEQVTVIDHMSDRVERSTIRAPGGHIGGDRYLTLSFADMVHGRGGPVSTLEDGLRSTAMCLAATRSCQSGAFESVTAVSRTAARTGVRA